MAMSTPAEIADFLAGSGEVSITYLSDLGYRCGGADASMVRLQRPTPKGGLITLRLDASEAAPVINALFENAGAHNRLAPYPAFPLATDIAVGGH